MTRAPVSEEHPSSLPLRGRRGLSLAATVLAVAGSSALVGLLTETPASAACTVSTTSVNFGAYNPKNGTADDSTGSVKVTCDKGSPAKNSTIALSPGNSGTYAARQMESGSNILTYNLYRNSARSQIWGDGSGGSFTLGYNGSGTFTVYGRIPALQNVQAGTYNDSLTVTITF